MNIYILDKDPIKSGKILLKADKRRANKMCVEFLQSSAVIAASLTYECDKFLVMAFFFHLANKC